MIKNNKPQELNDQAAVSWVVILAAGILLLAILAGLIYSFITPIP
jgi:hypothetical protein